MTASFTVRRYEAGDADRVRELHEAAMRDAGAFVEGVADSDLDDVRAAYLDAGGEFLVGTVDGRIVAAGAFRPAAGYVTEFLDGLPEATAEVKRMRVDPAHQRRGYGARLYAELERRARDRGVTRFVLDTTPEQVGARRFYETNGFEERRRAEARLAGESIEVVFYEKRIASGE